MPTFLEGREEHPQGLEGEQGLGRSELDREDNIVSIHMLVSSGNMIGVSYSLFESYLFGHNVALDSITVW